MKECYKSVLILFCVVTVITSCKKENSSSYQPTIKLSVADSGKTVNLAMGQTMTVTLSNPGDGGFNFDTWQYDATVLHLDNHTHTSPTNNEVIGDFGTDTWQFTSLKAGSSALKITATRGTTPPTTVTMFNEGIVVK